MLESKSPPKLEVIKMEVAVRILIYLAIGFSVLVLNVWFIRLVHKNFLDTDYVITPFRVINHSEQTSKDKVGEALAQMMVARLGKIQAQLRASKDVRQSLSQSGPDSLRNLAVTTLLIARPVEIPTNLLEPVNITIAVGGVYVGGIFAWIQKSLTKQRTLSFATYHEDERAIISADLADFSPTIRHLWIESDKHPDEIATNTAYALLQIKLAEIQSGRIMDLELADFRRLLEIVFQVDTLNQQAQRGYVTESDFVELLPSIETLVEKIPDWPQLIFITASIAEGAGNAGKAANYYRKLQNISSEEDRSAEKYLANLATKRLSKLGLLQQSISEEDQDRFVSEAHEFARLLSLKGPDPKIIFVEPQHPQIQALWNKEKQQYEVNPTFADTAGLPQYVALMGRFFNAHFNRCFGVEVTTQGTTSEFWNEFRYSIIDYLIQTQPEFKEIPRHSERFRLFNALMSMAKSIDDEPVKRLAFELLDRFDCDWTRETITGQMLLINKQRGFMPDIVIREAMKNQEFPTTDPS